MPIIKSMWLKYDEKAKTITATTPKLLKNITKFNSATFNKELTGKIKDKSTPVTLNLENCNRLESIELELGEHPIKLSAQCFGMCYGKLKTVNLTNCTEVGCRAFISCTSITKIELPDCKTIESKAFYGCTKLESIDLKSCESVGEEAFYCCEALKEIDLKSCETIGPNAFYGCEALTEIDLKSCTNVEYNAFAGCTNLEKINLKSCTNVGKGAFDGCTALKEITLPDKVATQCKKAGIIPKDIKVNS